MIPKDTIKPQSFPSYWYKFLKTYENKNIPAMSIMTEPGDLSYMPLKYVRYGVLDGYWQHEAYFKDYKETIQQIFAPNQDRLDRYAIHVRRGDYMKYKHLFNCLGDDYYLKAIEKIGRDKKFLVFSDGIEEAKQMFSSEIYDGIDFEYAEGNTEVGDIQMMARCKGNIIANSTFSWWGAWLNSKPEIVIIPDVWNGAENNADRSGLYCEGWVRL